MSKFGSKPAADGFVVKEDLCEKRESHDGTGETREENEGGKTDG